MKATIQMPIPTYVTCFHHTYTASTFIMEDFRVVQDQSHVGTGIELQDAFYLGCDGS